MKKFIVDTGKKKYSVEANDAEHAVELVKKIAVYDDLNDYRSAVKEAFDELSKIHGKYNEQDKILVRSVLRKASAAIARAKSNWEKWIF